MACYHTIKIDLPDWEAVDRLSTYNPKLQYKKCIKCNKIMEA